MQLNGTVISYTASTKIQKQGGGSYDAWELVYRSPENEVKQLAKPVQSLKYNKPLAGALAALKPNDEFTAELEKNAGGFWEVKSIAMGSAVASGTLPTPPAQASERPQAAPRAVNRVTGSTYETAEERAKKQVVIVRQSCIGYAVEMLSAKDRSLVNVINLAEELETWVHTDVSVAAKAYMDIKLNEEVPGGN